MSRLLIMLLLSFTCLSAQAFKVEPMSAEMAPMGKRAQMTMRIENSSPEPLTVELFPLSMTMDEYGKETITPADDDLLVIPVTAIIEPGRSQSVMVRYLGDPSITESKAYRVAIKQVAVERASKEQGQVSFLLQFNTLINVRPNNTNPELAIKSIKPSDNNKWLLEILNSGNSYGRLTKTNWRVTDGTHSTYIKGREIAQRIPGTLVLPNSTRYLEMQPIENFNVNTLSIEIDQEM
ncbi:molecular chaperone [Marinomonas ostreistagni]|uniref:molecular chaperone n=1 Tax=Marinomonas ostreistagni TaxID=359209 RepID=UPI001951923F|nr:molecular chaperone [Marinomonas ostreistagni]MBM6549904.1 molecular chaperone [Marinomonas ostreistagni]